MVNKKQLKNRLKYCDWLVWGSFGLMLATKFLTIFSFVKLTEITGADIAQVSNAFEANDLFRAAMQMQNIGLILGMIIIPASVMAYYFYMKRKVRLGKVDINTLEFFVQFAFFALIINVVNDLAGWLALLAK